MTIFSSGNAHLNALAVDKRSRKQGLGKGVVQSLVEIARNGGAKTILTYSSNPVASKLYESVDFSVLPPGHELQTPADSKFTALELNLS